MPLRLASSHLAWIDAQFKNLTVFQMPASITSKMAAFASMIE
jgi:hypothetical protein